MFWPASTAASRNRAAAVGIEPSRTRSCSRAALSTNLRMLTAANSRLIPSSTTCSRWPAGSIASTNGWRQVDAAAAGLEHPLDQLLHLGARQDHVGQLVPAVAGDEHPARLVDPDLLDLGVVEEPLQRTEAGDPWRPAPRPRRPGRAPARRRRSGCARRGRVRRPRPAVARARVDLRIDPFTAYDGAQLLVEVTDQVDRRISREAHGHVRWLPGNYGTGNRDFQPVDSDVTPVSGVDSGCSSNEARPTSRPGGYLQMRRSSPARRRFRLQVTFRIYGRSEAERLS